MASQIVPNASIPCYAHHVATTLEHVPHISTFPQVVSQAFGVGRRLGFMVNKWTFQTIQLNQPGNNYLGTSQTKGGPQKNQASSCQVCTMRFLSAKHSLHKSEPKNCPCFFVKRIGDQKSGSIEGCSFHFHQFLAASKLLTHLLLPQT